MKQYAFCPISDKKVNEKVIRMNALFTVLIIITLSALPNVFLALFLTVDFFLRAFDFGNLSLVGISSKNIVKLFSVNTHLINAGPKIFAARIGLVLSSLLALSFVLNLNILTYTLSGIIGLFAFLEFAFGLCVACKIYPYVYNMFYGKKSPNDIVKF